jgi:hypothetical protein
VADVAGRSQGVDSAIANAMIQSSGGERRNVVAKLRLSKQLQHADVVLALERLRRPGLVPMVCAVISIRPVRERACPPRVWGAGR